MKKIFFLLLLSISLAGCQSIDNIKNHFAADKCNHLKEMACLLNNNCIGAYGSSSCGEGGCSGDIVFQSCIKLSEEKMVKRDLCPQAGGIWNNKYGICICPKTQLPIDPETRKCE